MSQADKLRKLLAGPGVLVLPGCFDALSARLIERAGYPGAFMSGFAVSASRIAMPDLGLISYSEMVDQGRDICAAVDFPVIGDGDTGYGNAVNVQRTVRGYAQAGFACVMIEDQVAPKKCGHTQGKRIVGRDEAFGRVQAAVDARESLRNSGADILIMARTDANATDGMDEAIQRCQGFADIGADFTFLEAPRDEDEISPVNESMPWFPKEMTLFGKIRCPLGYHKREKRAHGYRDQCGRCWRLLLSLPRPETDDEED